MMQQICRRKGAALVVRALVVLVLTGARVWAVDFHVATGQDLQNALTQAAANGANDNIYLTNGYYVGNFNFNSSEARNLTLLPEPGVPNSGITIDGAGGGRALNLSSSSSTNDIIVQGITFLRNCGSTSVGSLRIGAGSNATILVVGCRFLSPTNTSGMGLEIDSGLNATVTNCIVAGATSGGGGTGMSISGLTGSVNVKSCSVISNSPSGLSVTANASLVIAGNTFSGNSDNGANGGYTGSVYACGKMVTLTGNNFSGNSGHAGGGFSMLGCASCTNVTLTGNNFTDNSGSYDIGGAYCVGTMVTLSGNTFTGNSARGSGGYGGGGGACLIGTTLTLLNNIFTGNSVNSTSSSRGGGAYCNGTATLSGNTFTGNSVTGSTGPNSGHGGGAYCNGTATLSGNTFTSNSVTADSRGGGVYCTTPVGNHTVILSGNTARLNTAGSGGGLYVDSSTVRLLDNLVVNNTQSSSSSKGGGVWVNARTNLAMINNTVFGNTAVGAGGGVAFQVDGVTEVLNVYNNIIWGNTATAGGADVHLIGTGSSKKFYFNDAHSMLGVWDSTGNTVDVDPQFFDPVNGDYHLRGTSPLVNTGTNGAPLLPATDLDGEPRIANGTVDLGCYEFSTAAKHPADTNNNSVITAAEFNAYAAAWKIGQPWSAAPFVIPADYVTRAGYLMTNGGTYHNDGSARPVNWKIGP